MGFLPSPPIVSGCLCRRVTPCLTVHLDQWWTIAETKELHDAVVTCGEHHYAHMRLIRYGCWGAHYLWVCYYTPVPGSIHPVRPAASYFISCSDCVILSVTKVRTFLYTALSPEQSDDPGFAPRCGFWRSVTSQHPAACDLSLSHFLHQTWHITSLTLTHSRAYFAEKRRTCTLPRDKSPYLPIQQSSTAGNPFKRRPPRSPLPNRTS